MLFQGMSQTLVGQHGIDVLPPAFLSRNKSAADQVRQNPLHGALSDSDKVGNFAGRDLTALSRAEQNVAVIAEKRPGSA